MSANENNLGIFKGIELIPLMFEEIKALRLQVEHLEKELIPKLDLTKRADVLKYLAVSNSTLDAMLRDGRFLEGVHFTKELKGKKNKIVFISSAIVNYKENM